MADTPHPLTVAEEREHVRRCAEGDQDSTGQLYDAYVARLYRYCLVRVGNETDAEDLAEEIFIKALGAIGRFEWRNLGSSDRSPFGAWLFGKSAVAARRALQEGLGNTDFLEAKIATARFFAGQLLPQVHGLLPSVTAGADAIYAVPATNLR